MSYSKTTLITLTDGRTLFRSGHSKTLARLPENTSSLTYFVNDNSGHGRGGSSQIIINRNVFHGPTTTDSDLVAAAKKA